MAALITEKRIFVSHSYEDASAKAWLLGMIQPYAEPVVFAPIKGSPAQGVSVDIVEAILGCDGLAYLTSDHSSRSFWVAFERDYALRAGLRVYRADPDHKELSKHSEPPLDLAVFSSYAKEDQPRVQRIVRHLESERHFDAWLDVEDLTAGQDWQKEIGKSLVDTVERGGYAVVFWSKATLNDKWIRSLTDQVSEAGFSLSDRVLVAQLDDTPLPEELHWEKPVQLFGDTELTATKRLDDLVVRLYWLIFRNTGTRELY